MKIKLLKYLLVLVGFLNFSCVEQPVNWTPTFDSAHTIPYGTYVLRKELKNIFPDSKIYNITEPTYDYFYQLFQIKNRDHYIYIDRFDRHSEETWEEISSYVSKGGSALISLAEGNNILEKNFGIKWAKIDQSDKDQLVRLSIKTPTQDNTYLYEKGARTTYFSNYNPELTDVLGYVEFEGKKLPNLLKVDYGDGYVLFQAEPIAFTNYHMLRNNNAEYVQNLFSYMEGENIIWDNHYIQYRYKEGDNGGFFNALSFILKHQSLRWALFILITMGLMYLFFNGKRKQKAIPIILPYKNYTLDFAKTLSALYRYHPDHTAMVRYKINYFLDQIRTRYHISSKEMEKDFSEILSAKSGVDLTTCEKLVLTIDIFKLKSYLDKEDFFKLQSLIETFNQKSQFYGRTNPGQ